MSYGTPDVYYQPEKFGLTQIAELDDPDACYSFDYLVLWQHEDGRLFYATDSGCSCPSPFEAHTSLDDLTEVTDESWAEFQTAVEQHCMPYTGEDANAADKTAMLAKAAEILRKRKLAAVKQAVQNNASLAGFTVLIENGQPRIAKVYYVEVEGED